MFAATPLPPEKLLRALAGSAGVFACVVFVFHLIEFAWCAGVRALRRRLGEQAAASRFPGHAPMAPWAALGLAFRHSLWIVPTTLAVSCAFTWAAGRLGFKLPQQELVEWLAGDFYSPSVKAAIVLYAMISAPVLEELIFRRFVFRLFFRYLPAWAAVGLSAVIFAAVHWNAAVFVPIAFLGACFAVIYLKTGRLLAPMLCHCVFNASNVVLIMLFPELVLS